MARNIAGSVQIPVDRTAPARLRSVANAAEMPSVERIVQEGIR